MTDRQSGVYLIEYALATVCVLLALLVPLPPTGDSVLQVVLDAVSANANHVDATMALP